MRRTYQAIIFCFAVVMNGFAQSDLRIGEWKSYMSHATGNFVAQSPDYIFFGSNGGLVQINKANDEVRFITKVEGLSDISVQALAWDQRTNRLVIAYQNSNLDIYDPKSSEVINLPDILRNTRILGDKIISRITIPPASDFAYLACGFGIVELNLKKNEFGFSAFSGVPVYEITIYKSKIYAAAESGLYAIENDKTKVNPGDFGQWQFLDAFGSGAYKAMTVFNNTMYLGSGKNIYTWDGATKNLIFAEPSSLHSIEYLSSNSDLLLVGFSCNNNCDGELYSIDKNNTVSSLNGSCVPRPIYAIIDEKGRGWFADRFQAFRSNNKITEACNFKYFNTPFSPFSTDIALKNDNVYVASGGIDASNSYLFRGDGFFSLSEGIWRVYNRGNQPAIQQADLVDLYKMAVDPVTGILYIGTFWGGLMQCDMTNIDDPAIKIFDKSNSSLQGAVGDLARTRIGGLTYDQKGNLWMTNYLAEKPISVYQKDGTWSSFTTPSNTTLLACAADSSGQIWFSVYNQGVLVYNPGSNITSTADDQMRLFNNGNSVITSNIINAITTDLDGSVWLGTSNGVFVFECGESVFDASCKGSKRVIVQLDLGANLLDNEDVQCIAVDGANRKWFGTRNGITVISAAGDQLIAKYTKDNSPLFDNLITALRYNTKSGEMYIGTGNGLQSLRTDATGASKSNQFSDIFAFPNPVRPEYTGPITIQGLRRNSFVKITDFAGNIVNKGSSNGGTYTWDGFDSFGRRISSGIYIAWISAGDGFESPDTKVLKIAIVK